MLLTKTNMHLFEKTTRFRFLRGKAAWYGLRYGAGHRGSAYKGQQPIRPNLIRCWARKTYFTTHEAIPAALGCRRSTSIPEAAAHDYRERCVIGPYRALTAETRRMEEQLSGACTVEVAAFDEFTSYIVDEKREADFEHVLYYRANRAAYAATVAIARRVSGFLATNKRGSSSCPMSGLKTCRKIRCARSRAFLTQAKPPGNMRPDRSAIQ
ncbi:MAG: hypothetical protein U0X75_07020 [Acidobacteriota bacterium]